jgi:hypothetical protein
LRICQEPTYFSSRLDQAGIEAPTLSGGLNGAERHGRADQQAGAVSELEDVDVRDSLDVDHVAGRHDPVGQHQHQVGAAGEHAGVRAALLEQANRLVECRWSQILKVAQRGASGRILHPVAALWQNVGRSAAPAAAEVARMPLHRGIAHRRKEEAMAEALRLSIEYCTS